MSLNRSGEITTIATAVLAVFAIVTAVNAIHAFHKQLQEVSDRASMLKLQAEQFGDHHQVKDLTWGYRRCEATR